MEKTRDAFFDNAKVLLIVLVVVGHTIEPLINDSRAFKSLYLFLYLFHMPAFIFITGYFSKSVYTPQKMISRLVIPYLIFQLLYTGLVEWTWFPFGDSVFTLIKPYWIMWFLLSLILWRLLLPYLKQFKYSLWVAAAIGILIGYISDAGYPFSVLRTFIFFPFFLAGHYTQKEHLKWLAHRWVRAVSLVLLVGLSVVFYQYPGMDERWLYASYNYAELQHKEWFAGLYRVAVYLGSIVAGICFFAVVPHRRFAGITNLGKNTLYTYLLHGFVVKYFALGGLYEGIEGPVEKLLLIGLGIGIALILSTPMIAKLFKFIVEPRVDFLFRREHAQNKPFKHTASTSKSAEAS